MQTYEEWIEWKSALTGRLLHSKVNKPTKPKMIITIVAKHNPIQWANVCVLEQCKQTAVSCMESLLMEWVAEWPLWIYVCMSVCLEHGNSHKLNPYNGYYLCISTNKIVNVMSQQIHLNTSDQKTCVIIAKPLR